MTVVADKQIEFNGLRLDGRQSGGSYEIQAIDGLADGAELRSSDKLRVARNGYVAGYSYLNGRVITIAVDITNFDSATFRSAVADFREAFAVRSGSAQYPLTFQFPGIADGVTAQINCKVRKLSLPLNSVYWSDYVTATVELFATDPLIYSAAETTTSLGLSAASGGLTFPLTFPLTFGATGISGITTVTNAGTAPSSPRFRIYGPVTSPTLRNETVNKGITVGVTLASGDYLDIDVPNRSVIANGTVSRYSSLTQAQWWDLEPGANQVRYSAVVGTGVTADMYWRSSWF